LAGVTLVICAWRLAVRKGRGMGRQLQLRILSWRAGRVARRRRGSLVFGLIALLVAGIVVVPRLPVGSRTFASACIPYTVRLPRAWRVQPVPMPGCGSPVLFDEYHLQVQGEQLTLSVQAVPLANGRYPDLSSRPQAVGGVRRRGGDGQIYSAYLEQDNGAMTANASFNRPPLDYQVTVESDGLVNPEPTLIQVMDGWSTTPAPNNPTVRAAPGT
jgi:hypothetical protein